MRISIDMWGTLIKASPFFGKEKIKLVNSFFPDHTEEEINLAFNVTKKNLNSYIETTGNQPTYDRIWKYLASRILKTNISDKCEWGYLENLHNEYQELSKEFPPVLFEKDTPIYLSKLHADGHELIISSNTMFLSGECLLKVLIDNHVADFFFGFNFSDEMGVAKPNKKMYSNSDFHIGDNILTDGIGAENANSNSIIINSTYFTIKDAYDIISKK